VATVALPRGLMHCMFSLSHFSGVTDTKILPNCQPLNSLDEIVIDLSYVL